ncbi:hypothetical protein AWC38_SpisGene13502 [Stylophora pistillata]|uniref:Uncharacterized protein n=1 Tax=Stylophora pistillata TaxID=50429 RepID=A0A2B4RXU8_STYPI|nr:hypothetical protein AWC38_SpisGene13502 [Stylophora pistillata]
MSVLLQDRTLTGASNKALSSADYDPNEKLSSLSSSSSSSSSSLSSRRKVMVSEHNCSKPSDEGELGELSSGVEAQRLAKGDVKQVGNSCGATTAGSGMVTNSIFEKSVQACV